MEYWIVYDLATGEELYPGSGTAGAAAYQQLPEGAGIMLVPQAVLATQPRNLAALKAALAARVDAEAEALCLRFVTPGTTQAMRYQRKEAEARAWLDDNSVTGPFLAAEAADCEMSVAEVVAEVMAMADPWLLIGSRVEARRMRTKRRIAAAQTFGGIVLAAQADWDTLLAALQETSG